jgi:hypothetical protein
MQARALDALGKVKRVNGRLRYATDSAAHMKKERFQRSDTHAHADAPRNVRSHAVIHGSARVFGHQRRLRRLRRLRRPSPVVLSQTTTHRQSSYRKTLFHAIAPATVTDTIPALPHSYFTHVCCCCCFRTLKTHQKKSHSLCALHALAPSRPRPNPPISSRLCPHIPVPRSFSHLHSKAQYTNKTHTPSRPSHDTLPTHLISCARVAAKSRTR